MTKTSNINDAMRVLSERYRRELPTKIADIGMVVHSLLQTEYIDADKAQLLYRMVHSLTGSGATFGLNGLSDSARSMEIFIKEKVVNAERWTPETKQQINTLWNEVKLSTETPDSDVVLQIKPPASASVIAAAIEPVKKVSGTIFLQEADVEQAANLKLQLVHFGYVVNVFEDVSSLLAAVTKSIPSVIIVAVEGMGDNIINDLAGIPEEIKSKVPLIIISSNNDINSRLAAVRAGAVAYIPKPVDMGVLIDKLDEVCNDISSDPFKVLIIDDSRSLASYYSLTLQSAGMETVVVTDPFNMLDAISNFTPELILMDMYMPGCSGLELAKIIRQQETYVSTPIVFLSAETNIEKQLEAMQLGADDFLTKPIQAAHLLSSVTSRIKRYRVIRSFMVRDSLTGLLNHTKTKEELVVEISRAQRQNNSMVFAMIDIDLFKNVNDSYGHPAGDRVIKSLSRLLQQRLRKTDIVGRYGGEEFAVILKDTDGQRAFDTMDSIRQAYEQITQHSENQEFKVTFSCGLAVFPEFATADELNIAADKALYEAKGAGRNRVVKA